MGPIFVFKRAPERFKNFFVNDALQKHLQRRAAKPKRANFKFLPRNHIVIMFIVRNASKRQRLFAKYQKRFDVRSEHFLSSCSAALDIAARKAVHRQPDCGISTWCYQKQALYRFNVANGTGALEDTSSGNSSRAPNPK